MAGRPTSLTPDVRAKLCDAMRIGCYQYEAAQHAGVHNNSVTNWLRTGREDIAAGRETPHAEFVEEFERAEASAIIRALGYVQRAAAEQHDWRAAMCWLSRRHRDRWSEHASVNMRVEHVDPADIELDHLIREARVKQAADEEMLRRGGDESGEKTE